MADQWCSGNVTLLHSGRSPPGEDDEKDLVLTGKREAVVVMIRFGFVCASVLHWPVNMSGCMPHVRARHQPPAS